MKPTTAALGSLLMLATAPALSQTSPAVATPPDARQPAPDSLVLYFDTNSARIRPRDQALLDQAARLYRDGHPVLMTLTGQADQVGLAANNLKLSSMRAVSVLDQLVARGIPAERFELVAKGNTDEPVASKVGVPEPLDRRVEIRWR